MKARFPVLEHIAELHLHHTGQVFTHQVAQIPLPCHKADQRNGPIRIGRLHQLDQLGSLAADKVDVRRVAGQPKHQLVQKQDDGVVTQRPRMPAHDAQAIVKRHVRLATTGQRPVGGEKPRDQVADQARSFFSIRRLQHGRFEGHRVPTAVQGSPTTVAAAATAFVQLGEKRVIAHALTHLTSVLEQALRQVEAGNWRLRVLLAHVFGVLPQDGRFHVPRADHVIRHQQELPAIRPPMAGDHVGQLRRRACLRVAGQQQVQHRHEVALAGAETAMQIGRLAAAGLHRLLDEAQRVGERIYQLRRHNVISQGLLGLGDALGELQDEVALVHPLRNGDQVFQQGHVKRLSCFAGTGNIRALKNGEPSWQQPAELQRPAIRLFSSSHENAR